MFSRIVDEIMAEAAKEADFGEGVSVYRAQGKKMALRDMNERVNRIIDEGRDEEREEKENGETEAEA